MKSYLLLMVAALMGCASALPPIMQEAEIMSRGWDMVNGVQNSTNGGKALLPVYQFHYTTGNTWTDPSDPSLSYTIPDELTATNVDFSDTMINAGIMNSYSQWISDLQLNFNVDAGVKCGNGTKALSLNFKYNLESDNYHEHSVNDSAASGFSKHELALFSLESMPPEIMTISPGFTAFVNKLPGTISSPADQKMYNQLVQYWGTHFASYANFGGHVHVSTFVKKSFLESKSTSYIKNQFALTFNYYMANMTGGGSVNGSHIHIDSAFKEASTTSIYYRGGDITLQSKDTVGLWLKSIPKNPLWLNTTMSDLSVLITDSAKAANVQKTIASYIANGVLPSTEADADYKAMYADFKFQPLRAEHLIPSKSMWRRSLRGASD